MTSSTPLRSWAELTQVAERCSTDAWIFRGEPQAGNPLRPRAGRFGTERGSPRKVPHTVAHEKAALETLKRQARPYLDHTPGSGLEWLAIGQHHGMSTRLLDWTESILIAAFFAAEEAGTKGDAVIYGLTNLASVIEAEEHDPFSLDRSVAIYRPPHITPRIPAQRSVFTLHQDPTVNLWTPALHEWRISEEACKDIKPVLDACGINESALFPDLVGLCGYLAWRYKWGKF